MVMRSFSRTLAANPAPLGAVLFAFLLVAAVPASVSAEPPCWAPAHGYRAKHGNKGCGKHHRKQHRSKRHDHRYGGAERYERYDERPAPSAGRQSSGGISAGGLVGAAVGGYAGSKVGKGTGKLAATAGGAVAGYIVGQEVEEALTEPAR